MGPTPSDAPTGGPVAAPASAPRTRAAGPQHARGAEEPAAPAASTAPEHVGVIIDGNRRWAQGRGLSTADGHREGARRISDVLRWMDERGIALGTIWMLSTDNANRPADELQALFGIIAATVEDIAADGFSIRIIGDLSLIPAASRQRIGAAIDGADIRRDMQVNLAVGYGGRREIVDAVRTSLRDAVAAGADPMEAIARLSEQDVADHLYTAGQPDPDLIIRTSGEERLSGFLLWECVHTELVFTQTLWPDFSEQDLDAALEEFAGRDRRYGA
nr:polyprenyl diphosphate synthase [Helcobacillus massiliensis]